MKIRNNTVNSTNKGIVFTNNVKIIMNININHILLKLILILGSILSLKPFINKIIPNNIKIMER